LAEKKIQELGEFGLIDHITGDILLKNSNTIKGIGDDAAVIRRGEKAVLISTDMLVEGIHFDMMYSPLMHLGYKSVVVNLSDIYAMNSIPTHITVSIALSSKYDTAAVEELYKGIKKACDFYNVDLIGGDTTSSLKGLIISVTAYGTAEEKNIVYRSGAKNGDVLCVTGDLGAAYLGLQILEREKRLYLDNPGVQPELGKHQYAIERQLKPEPRRDTIEFFKKNSFRPTAMIDVSDGLSSDLMHLCKQSNLGAHIEESKVPMHDETQTLAIDFRLDPITCALSGGEDYELLFCIDPKDLENIRYMPDISIIGEMNDIKDGIKLHTTGGNIYPLKAQGWNHF
jgi:thiamine-monophosphate kinase